MFTSKKKFNAAEYGPVIRSIDMHTTVTEPALIRFDQAQDNLVLEAIWAPCRAVSSMSTADDQAQDPLVVIGGGE